MKIRTVQHAFLTEDRPLTRLLWLLFWTSLWVSGFVVAELIIEKLYFR
jgi:hypothetical protein